MSLNPAQLTIGHDYKFRITSRFAYGATLVPASTADYDNVLPSSAAKTRNPFETQTCAAGAGLVPAGGHVDSKKKGLAGKHGFPALHKLLHAATV